jgi:hypothetical protein
LTDLEKDLFEALHEAALAPVFGGPSPLVIRAKLDEQDVAVYAAMLEETEGGHVNIGPLAILITPSLMERITPPDGTVRIPPTQ